MRRDAASNGHRATVPRTSIDRAPEPVESVVDMMPGFGRTWYLCGGWAGDAWLGHQTRDHLDVDMVVFHEDQHAIFEQFSDAQLIAHDRNVADDTDERWDGRPLDLPAHVHGTSPESVKFEFVLNERSENGWILHEEPRIMVPLSSSVRPSTWAPSTVVPEVLLFFKATGHLEVEDLFDRPHDRQDFLALSPQLSNEERSWLQEAISLVHADHPWLADLTTA